MNRLKVLIIVATLAVACSKEDGSDANVGYGSAKIVVTTDSVVAVGETRADSYYEIPSALLPSSADLVLSIVGEYVDPESGETKQFNSQYESLDAYNEDEPLLYAGEYTATVSNYTDLAGEGETYACFSGSANFEVVARTTGSITIPATLQNSIVRITATSDFCNYYENGAELTASTDAGSTLLYSHPDNSANDGKILFVAPETTLYLEGWGVKQNPTESTTASTTTFVKSVIGQTVASQMSTISVDAGSTGGAGLTITLDDSITKVYEESVQLNPLP